MKKLLTLFIVFLFLFFPKLSLAQTSVPILMYHFVGNNPKPTDTARNILSIAPEKFEEQMEYLQKNGFTPIDLNTLYGIYNNQVSAPNRPVVLTFDDGYIDFYTTAYPILAKYNYKAVSFIPTGLIGTGYYMNWDQIKEIQRSGLVTFEGHTVNHPNLILLSSAQTLKELKDGRELLQSQTGYPVNFIAYPGGTSNFQVQELAKQAGFVGGVGTWIGKATGPGINMPRIRINGQFTLTDFSQKL